MNKILLINTKYKKYGGEDSNFQEEVKFLRKFNQVEILQFDNSSKLSWADILAFFTLTNYSSNKILKKKLKTFNPDLVYIHNTWFKSSLGIFKILKKQDIKTALKIHNFRFSCTDSFRSKYHFQNNIVCHRCGNKKKKYSIFNKYFKNSYIKSFFVILYGKKYIKILRQYPIKIVALNSFYQNHLLQKEIDNKKLYILNNPIEASDINDYSANSDYVVYAGSLLEQKGVEELIIAWERSKVNLKLKIVGTGDLMIKLKLRYLLPNIEIIGYLDNSEVIELIKYSRAVVTATKMFEGQPRLLSESSAYGVPSIYPSFGGMNEYFPQNYILSFEQFNYEDLVNKIKLLENKTLLIEESKKIFEFTKKNMSFKTAMKSFELILN